MDGTGNQGIKSEAQSQMEGHPARNGLVVHQNLPRTEKAVNPCPLCPRTFAVL
jgi:hypothetical protein